MAEAGPVANVAIEPGHNKVYDRTWGGAKANPRAVINASGLIQAVPGIWYGWLVTVAVATAPLLIRDGGASGAIIDIVPVGAIGTYKEHTNGKTCGINIYLDLNGGTGTIVPYTL